MRPKCEKEPDLHRVWQGGAAGSKPEVEESARNWWQKTTVVMGKE